MRQLFSQRKPKPKRKNPPNTGERLIRAEVLLGWTCAIVMVWTVSLPLQWGATPGKWIAVQGLVAFWVCLSVLSNNWVRAKEAAAEEHAVRMRRP